MGLLARIKTWVSTEDVTYIDLNAEFNNILDNLTPLYVDDYSTNTAQMQVQTDPGEVGTESKATTLAGEIARIRFILKEITGEDYWYESPSTTLLGLGNAIGTGLAENRLVSGRVLTTSDQPAFLVPNGAARTVKVDGTPTSFVYFIEGVQYTISSDVTITNLTAAPSSNNTAAINEPLATADEYWTKYQGEDGTSITVDAMGSEISALVGKFAGFKIAGASTEYFIAYVKSSTELTKARRGYFFDSTDAPIPRTAYTDNDTITLMKLTWIFANTAGALTATYTNPIWSDDEPSSPAVNDYWFDTSANKWKVYGVSSFSDADATLVGVCLQDATNCVAARSFEFFKNYDMTNTVEIIAESVTQVKSRHPGAVINAWGEAIKSEYGLHTWDMTLDLESGVTEAASTYYYFYITETGDKIISNKKPHDRREDLLGYYHPSQSWRCVGRAFNNGSSNLQEIESYYRSQPGDVFRAVAATDLIQPRDRVITLSGASFTQTLPPAANYRGRSLTYIHGGTSLTQVYTLDGNASETIGGATTVALYTALEALVIQSDGSNWHIISHYAKTTWIDGGAIVLTSTGGGVTKATTPLRDKMWWMRDGKDLLIRLEYEQNNVTGAVDGTGDYLFGLPGSGAISIDTTVADVHTTAASSASCSSCLGVAQASNNTDAGIGSAVLYDSATVRLHVRSEAGGGFSPVSATASRFDVNNTNVAWAASYRVPITGWLP